jgi:group I intron endonuclease
MKVDYSQGKIYKITNDYNNDVYVGSTCDTLCKRFSGHKRSMTGEKTKNSLIYKLMNEIGFERFRIELIENCPCEDVYQLRQREGVFIRLYGTLNKRIEDGCKTREEYKNVKKDYITE